ncbi:helix-turn-helix domain-containing protein [Aerococcaceae bacterium WGS1372]
MNIERFIEQRKMKGVSQSELCDGICTQATLSRFENNGHIPNIKILIQLCNRLDLSLSELFPKVEIQNDEIVRQMDKAEFQLILSEYSIATKIINQIQTDTLDYPHLKTRYFYLKAFTMIHNNETPTDCLFMLDQILLMQTQEDSNIFSLIAYTGSGMVYYSMNDVEKAEVYFNKVLEQIYTMQTNSTEDIWRVLHIVYQSSQFYSDIGEIDISNELAKHAIRICSDNHVTYYLARAAIQLAENAMKTDEAKEEILELIYDARAYSKINRNTIGLKKLKQMEDKVLYK